MVDPTSVAVSPAPGGIGGPPATATTTKADAQSGGVSDILEDRLIDAEYKIWKKNTPYLYDFVMTHALEWPSLTCQWLPVTKNAPGGGGGGGGSSSNAAVEHSLLLGTHTTGEQNHLMVASVNLPRSDAVIDNRAGDDGGDVDAGNGNSMDKDATHTATNYDDERNELGGFGAAAGAVGKITVRMKVNHRGEVNWARYMPQNHFVVASRGPQPEVYIWDLSKHPSFPPEDGSPFAPQGVCVGHTKEGYGLAWSGHTPSRLISGSEDKTVCLWDVTAVTAARKGPGTGGGGGDGTSTESGAQIQPLSVFRGHTDVVEDVDWHHRDPHLIGSVGDDRSIRVWDVRESNPTKSVHVVAKAHGGDVNSIAFNPVNEFLLATGSGDKTVRLWDMRNLKSPMQTFEGHTDQVYNVEWAPHNESILASCSADRRVAIWDLSRIGMEQSPEDAEDGPPELLFLHGGHTSKVSDISWNANDEWTIASCSEDNILQVWNMAEEIYAEGGDVQDEGGAVGEGEGDAEGVIGEDDLE